MAAFNCGEFDWRKSTNRIDSISISLTMSIGGTIPYGFTSPTSCGSSWTDSAAASKTFNRVSVDSDAETEDPEDESFYLVFACCEKAPHISNFKSGGGFSKEMTFTAHRSGSYFGSETCTGSFSSDSDGQYVTIGISTLLDGGYSLVANGSTSATAGFGLISEVFESLDAMKGDHTFEIDVVADLGWDAAYNSGGITVTISIA